MFCPKCGAKLADNSKFCTKCGASLEGAAQVMAEVRERTNANVSPSEPSGETYDAGPSMADAVDEAVEVEPEFERVEQASIETPQMSEPVQPSTAANVASQVAAPQRKEPKALYIVGIVVGLIVIALVSWQLFFNGSGGNIVTFGQKESVVCALDTKVIPTDSDGNKITSFVAELIDEDGRSSKVKVTGESGFSIGKFKDAAEGSYTLKVTNKQTKVEYSIPVKIVSDNRKSEAETEITVQAPGKDAAADTKKDAAADTKKDNAGEKDADPTQVAAYRAYNQKCREYLNKYGEAHVVETYGYALTGFCVADLVDFDNDGNDELLTITCDLDEGASQMDWIGTDSTKPYEVEVWSYVDGGLKRIYEQHWVDHSNGGGEYLSLTEKSGSIFIESNMYMMSDQMKAMCEEGNVLSASITTMRGKKGDAFEDDISMENAVKEMSGANESFYLVRGMPASDGEYIEALKSYEQHATYALLDFSMTRNEYQDSTYLSLQDVQQRTADTLSKLEKA